MFARPNMPSRKVIAMMFRSHPYSALIWLVLSVRPEHAESSPTLDVCASTSSPALELAAFCPPNGCGGFCLACFLAIHYCMGMAILLLDRGNDVSCRSSLPLRANIFPQCVEGIRRFCPGIGAPTDEYDLQFN
jgi:hypothetical protein